MHAATHEPSTVASETSGSSVTRYSPWMMCMRFPWETLPTCTGLTPSLMLHCSLPITFSMWAFTEAAVNGLAR